MGKRKIETDYRFDMINETMVKTLKKKSVNAVKDQLWNNKVINSAMTQGIMQGESIPKLANRVSQISNRLAHESIRTARTLCTSAENQARYDDIIKASAKGINCKKMWMSTHDKRTRLSHILIDGEKRDISEKFGNGLLYPGDPNGIGAEIYNCRCTLVSVVVGFTGKTGTTSVATELQGYSDRAGDYWNPDKLEPKMWRLLGLKNKTPYAVSRALQKVNPNFDNPAFQYNDYHNNCQRCVQAYELQRRGYDVEALRFDGEYLNWDKLFEDGKKYWDDYDNYVASGNNFPWGISHNYQKTLVGNPNKFGEGAKKASETICNTMHKWGDGSRAMLSVFWRSGGGHIVNVEYDVGKIKIVDAQSGKIVAVGKKQIENYMLRTNCISSCLYRVDHLKIQGDKAVAKVKRIVKKR